MSEKPGAQTPWKCIDQLLSPDERFDMHISNWKGFLLVPKHASQLAALLYLLREEGIVFHVQGKGTSALPAANCSIIVSARAFSHLVWHEHGVVEAGAGCMLSHLQQFLFERKQEVALEEAPLNSPKRSVAGLILSGRTSAIRYRSEGLPANILGIEWIARDGSQITWGGQHRSAAAGPVLHKLIWGLHSWPGIIIKVILKTSPIPPVRLRLAWKFRRQEDLWKQVHELKHLASTWESLEAVRSGQSTDQGFVFAQISGLPEEMEAFAHECPGYAMAHQQGERRHLSNFLQRQTLNCHLASRDHPLKPGEYLWMQEEDQRAWWLTHRPSEKEECLLPIWKQRFWNSLAANDHG